MKRKLAAVMFTDMVGYTAMMSENEQKAKQQRGRHRQIIETAVAVHQGDIVQYFGDGSLIIFESAVESIRCGIDIQKQMLSEPQIPLRIGIHLGDIVRTEDGIYGEGVNVASRIESFSKPGAVLLSERIYHELSNHPEFTTRFLGTFDLKNVKYALGIYAIVVPPLYVPSPSEMSGKGVKSLKGIAVLPFENFSSDPENEFFSDGVTEEILNALVRIDGLKVTSRTTSFALKNDKRPLKEIANQLGVQTILEGSVRKAGNRVRITAQLIDGQTDHHYWSETFDRQLEDIFAVQDEIANRIAEKLKIQFDSSKAIDIHHTTKNMQAYEAYLKGRFYVNKFTPPDGFVALEYFQKSQQLDPEYVMPITGLASMYSFLGAIGALHPKKAFPRAEQNAIRALEMDPQNPNSHSAMALVELFYYWQWDKVEFHLNECQKSNQPDLMYYVASFMYLAAHQRNEELIEVMNRGKSLDPLNPFLNFLIAQAHLYMGDFDKGESMLDDLLTMNPNYRAALEAKGWVYLARGQVEKAIEFLIKYHRLVGDPNKGISFLGYVYGKYGYPEKAKELLNRLHIRKKQNPDEELSADFAQIYLGLGEVDKSLEFLESAVQHRLGFVIFLSIYPIWQELKGNPEFERLLQKIGLPRKGD